MKLSGGCLCGSIRYQVTTKSLDGGYCHCRMCQLAFGNTHASFLNVLKRNLIWKKKPRFYKSSKFASRGFCGKCGTPLSFAYNDSEKIDISIGSLDHPGKTKPKLHFAIETIVKSWFHKDKLKKIPLKSHKALMATWKKYYGSKEQGPGTARAKP